MKYSKIPQAERLFILRDMSTAAEYGSLRSDARIQVKMPTFVVDALDTLFPHKDRSAVLTELAIQAILQKEKFADRPELREMQASEQSDLDDLWNYLEVRDGK